MLILDFINVGNGDSILIQELEGGVRRFAMLVDCGHDNLIRDDHPAPTDPRSSRIYAGDFLKKQGVGHLDILLLTHFHRDHIGGLGRVLEAATVGRVICSYVPPEGNGPLDPDGDNGLPKAARNLLRCVDMYAQALREHPGRIHGASRRQDRNASADRTSHNGHHIRRTCPVSPAEGGIRLGLPG